MIDLRKASKIGSKILFYFVSIIVSLVLLIKGLGTYMWGSGNDILVLGAPFVIILGLSVIARIAADKSSTPAQSV